MRLDKVDLNLFVVFDAVYRERSVTRVAAQLNLTQPAVSNALGRLRQTFDDPLFVRTPEGMAPTPVADNVVRDIRSALELLGRSVGASARFDPVTSEKHYRLGMNDMAEFTLMPGLLRELKGQAPGVTLSCHMVPRDQATEQLKAGQIDLLVDAPAFNARELLQQPLVEFEYVLAMRRDHPLAHKAVSMEDYLAAEHLLVSSRSRGRGHADIALHRRGMRRRVTLRVQNYLAAARITNGSDLLWTVPDRAVADSGLHVTALPFAVESLSWNLYWPRSAEDDPASRWMRELIGSLLPDGRISAPG